MNSFRADLHVHTCLSACADVGMSPRRIAEEASKKRIDILGVCDHNSAENAGAVAEAAGRLGIRVFPGLEITTREEVHILALFETLESALEMQEEVYNHLPGENDEAVFGSQVVASAENEVLRFNTRLLLGAVTLPLAGIVDGVRARQGLAVAAHIDRRSFGLVGQLGLIPERLALDALEISPQMTIEEARARYGPAFPLLQSSDAHAPEEIGSIATTFVLEAATVEEIRRAFRGREGRGLIQ